jgi:hypothetical protein
MFPYDRPNHRRVVFPDCLDETASEHEPRPADDAIASRKRKLRLGQLGCAVTVLHLAQEVFRLMFQLIEVGPNRKVAIRHDEPPWYMPGVC